MIDWIFYLTLDLLYDVYETKNSKESLEYLINCTKIVADSKNKKPLNNYDNKGQTWTSLSSDFGNIKDDLTLDWINMLLTISGLTEYKAIAIVKKYPTITSLMKSYLACNDAKSKENMLADIIVDTESDNNKKIGKSLSNKIYRIFTVIDPNE